MQSARIAEATTLAEAVVATFTPPVLIGYAALLAAITTLFALAVRYTPAPHVTAYDLPNTIWTGQPSTRVRISAKDIGTALFSLVFTSAVFLSMAGVLSHDGPWAVVLFWSPLLPLGLFLTCLGPPFLNSWLNKRTLYVVMKTEVQVWHVRSTEVFTPDELKPPTPIPKPDGTWTVYFGKTARFEELATREEAEGAVRALREMLSGAGAGGELRSQV